MTVPITLAAGDCETTVEPDFGGRITALRHGGVDLFVPIAEGPRDLAVSPSGGCYPLVPWSNRIRDGRLMVADRVLRLPATEGGKPHAIHGHGLRREWTVVDNTAAQVSMTYAHTSDVENWPWSYQAEQIITQKPDGLSLTLSVTNHGEAPMPVGLGLHPYLPRDDDTRITFAAATAWPSVEAEKFPTGSQPLPTALDARDGIPVPLGLDQGFGGWAGSARIDWPERGRTLTIAANPAFGHLIVYTPPDQLFFCVEPVSHAIDAANLSARGVEDTGHRVLAPGETFIAGVRFKIAVI